jgi:2-phosphoglycerate kinase
MKTLNVTPTQSEDRARLMAKLIFAVTRYDRAQEKRPRGGYYNQYALAQYMVAVDRIMDAHDRGIPLVEAIDKHTCDRLRDVLRKAIGEPKYTYEWDR